MSYSYIASPYTKYANGIEAAHRDVCEAVGVLVKLGMNCYSPIAHSHPIAIHGGLDPLNCDFWMGLNYAMMNHAKELIVIKMDGWEQSKGIMAEIKAFRLLGKTVLFLSWPELVFEDNGA